MNKMQCTNVLFSAHTTFFFLSISMNLQRPKWWAILNHFSSILDVYCNPKVMGNVEGQNGKEGKWLESKFLKCKQ